MGALFVSLARTTAGDPNFCRFINNKSARTVVPLILTLTSTPLRVSYHKLTYSRHKVIKIRNAQQCKAVSTHSVSPKKPYTRASCFFCFFFVFFLYKILYDFRAVARVVKINNPDSWKIYNFPRFEFSLFFQMRCVKVASAAHGILICHDICELVT